MVGATALSSARTLGSDGIKQYGRDYTATSWCTGDEDRTHPSSNYACDHICIYVFQQTTCSETSNIYQPCTFQVDRSIFAAAAKLELSLEPTHIIRMMFDNLLDKKKQRAAAISWIQLFGAKAVFAPGSASTTFQNTFEMSKADRKQILKAPNVASHHEVLHYLSRVKSATENLVLTRNGSVRTFIGTNSPVSRRAHSKQSETLGPLPRVQRGSNNLD